jgi:hypothetical protein
MPARRSTTHVSLRGSCVSVGLNYPNFIGSVETKNMRSSGEFFSKALRRAVARALCFGSGEMT